ncbi:hypothetical protein LTR53_013331 [Teratosphaeriaceae sp. CCFEE 6253]|nr:hypothetical protein LTR53_013331 [Teratosphaeriaceae sp. CCFEE 6253]
MSSADAQQAFQQNVPKFHVEAQDNFTKTFDLSRPQVAMTSYQKLLHQHTKLQFDSASALSRRRSANASAAIATLKSEDSTGSTRSSSP